MNLLKTQLEDQIKATFKNIEIVYFKFDKQMYLLAWRKNTDPKIFCTWAMRDISQTAIEGLIDQMQNMMNWNPSVFPQDIHTQLSTPFQNFITNWEDTNCSCEKCKTIRSHKDLETIVCS